MLEFKKLSEFPKGTLYDQLVDAYSFNNKCKKNNIKIDLFDCF